MTGIAKEEESGSPSWGASFFTQTTEDVAKAVAAAMNSERPSVIYSSKTDHGGSQLQRLQSQVTKLIKGFSGTSEVKYANYNPEILTSQKRQWAANFHLQYMDHKSWKEPSRLFESMVVVGLHPNCDIQALQRQYIDRKSEGSGKLRSALGYHNQSRVEPNLEPQVLFAYPPDKQLPLKDKDLFSFCFPGGLEVNAVERTPSMSELNEILFGQVFMQYYASINTMHLANCFHDQYWLEFLPSSFQYLISYYLLTNLLKWYISLSIWLPCIYRFIVYRPSNYKDILLLHAVYFLKMGRYHVSVS